MDAGDSRGHAFLCTAFQCFFWQAVLQYRAVLQRAQRNLAWVVRHAKQENTGWYSGHASAAASSGRSIANLLGPPPCRSWSLPFARLERPADCAGPRWAAEGAREMSAYNRCAG